MADWFYVLGGAALCGVTYFLWRGMLVEPRCLVVERYLLRLPRLPSAADGLRVVFLSDLHLQPNGFGVDLAEQAVLRANETDPDVVLLGGDLVHWCGAVPYLIPVLRRLHSRYGVFAVLGNHDHHCPWRWQKPAPWGGKPLTEQGWREALAQAGVQLLVNEATSLLVNGAHVWIAGVDDAYTGRNDLAKALSGVPDDAFVLLLSHSPDVVDAPLIHRVALVMCGHTHGGQVVLPLVGPLWVPCRNPKQRAQGLVRLNGTWLYVSRGVSAGLPLRFRCPPEVTVFTLRALPNEG